MKNRQGMDAFSLLSDVLFESTGGPIPSFGPKGPQVTPEKDAASTDIVKSKPSWQPAQ
jgi:hypothetical protein